MSNHTYERDLLTSYFFPHAPVPVHNSLGWSDFDCVALFTAHRKKQCHRET